MEKVRILTAEEAAALVRDNDTITTSGFVSCSNAEHLNKALEKRFLETGSPKNLTLIYASSQGGTKDGRGADRYAHKGLLKRVIAGHFNTAPSIGKLAVDNEIEAYNIPQGTLLNIFRDTAAKKPGTITTVGLKTFADPRNGGGKVNSKTTDDLGKIINIDGKDVIFYKNIPMDVAFIRGTYADEYGNITFEKEVTPLEGTSTAQAVVNSGGKVIVQVERVVKAGTLDPKLVKIPGIYVYAVVVCDDKKDHEQCLDWDYDPCLTGERRAVTEAVPAVALSAKKVIGRRAAMELRPNTVVNLGIGAPEYVAAVAGEEGIGDYMTLTVESGPIGGIPQGGKRFGSSLNPDCLMDQPYQFDFYDGGGLDYAFLGLAQADEAGNINVSRFGSRLAGCGGFINITQNAKNVIFCGTFTSGGLKVDFSDGKLHIAQEGREKKFLKNVEQITFSGDFAKEKGQSILYITERAVFKLEKDGVYLTEIAPGVNLEKDIFAQMDFLPKMNKVKTMDASIFKDEKMIKKNV